MEIQQGFFKIDMQEGMSCVLKNVSENDGVEMYEFALSWTKENAAADDGFDISWQDPMERIMYKWDSRCLLHRDVYPHWDDTFTSMISRSAPVTCYFDGNDTNGYCWALSECRKLVTIKNGIDDQFGVLNPHFSIRTRQYTNQYAAAVTLRIDKRPVPMRRAVEDVASWWEKDLRMTPMQVPDPAREPLYSFWYSYHKDVDEKNVEEKCRWAKNLGFDICIVDDGWQTDINSGAYGYCGDWQPAPSKLPDMAGHVQRVHDIGMKYVLWYSVPFVGHFSVHYEHFKDMILRDEAELYASVLDPRYKEVREFLVNTYKKALLEWKLDGFKLDFIDCWSDAPDNAPYHEKMDIPALQDAVDVCMSEIVETLQAIKPDILLEFRQEYIGPHMKRFGNMFRVGDCAGNYLKNRASILDLRMLMGNQAVHSDMLMMAPGEKPETNAVQIISCMFGVLQYSGRMEIMTPEMTEMSVFWLNFLKEHRALLQSENLETHEAHLLYTWAKAAKDDECAIGVYAIDKCVKPDPVGTIYIANGCTGERVLVELAGTYQVQVLDCFGHEVSCGEKEFAGITQIAVPVGGLAVLRK